MSHPKLVQFGLIAASLVSTAGGATLAATSIAPTIESIVEAVQEVPTTFKPITSESARLQSAEFVSNGSQLVIGIISTILGINGLCVAGRNARGTSCGLG